MTSIQIIVAIIGGILASISTGLGIWKKVIGYQSKMLEIKEIASSGLANSKLQLGLQELGRGDLDNAYYHLMQALDAYGKSHDEPNMYIVRSYLDQIPLRRSVAGYIVFNDEKTQPTRRVGR